MSPATEKVAEVVDELTAGWNTCEIQHVAEVNPRIDKKAIPDDIEVSFVPMPAVKAESGEIDVSQTKLAKNVKKGFTAFLQGDVLFAKITPCMENGKMAIAPALVNGYGFGSTEFHVLRAGSDLDAKYLYFYVSSKSFRGEAERFMTGAVGQKRVSTSYIKEATIPVAPLEDQKWIVAEIEKQFSRLDEAVASLKRVKANLKRYKAAVLKAAVEGKLTEEWRKQNPDVEPASKLLERILAERRTRWEEAELAKMKAKGKEPKNNKWKEKYKESPLGQTDALSEIPEGWVVTRLDQVAEIRGGITKDSKRKANSVETLPYLRVANVQRGWIDISEMKEIDVPSEKVADLLLEPGDILFNEGGDRDKLGRGWVWEGQIERCIYQNHVFRARLVKASVIEPKFVSWYGNGVGQRFFMARGKQTTNLASINKTMLSSLPIPIPPAGEQSEIRKLVEEELSRLDELEVVAGKTLLRAGFLRQSVLSEAFSGRMEKSNR